MLVIFPVFDSVSNPVIAPLTVHHFDFDFPVSTDCKEMIMPVGTEETRFLSIRDSNPPMRPACDAFRQTFVRIENIINYNTVRQRPNHALVLSGLAKHRGGLPPLLPLPIASLHLPFTREAREPGAGSWI